jgi:hypothetical protein
MGPRLLLLKPSIRRPAPTVCVRLPHVRCHTPKIRGSGKYAARRGQIVSGQARGYKIYAGLVLINAPQSVDHLAVSSATRGLTVAEPIP